MNNILEYALNSIFKSGGKNFFIGAIFIFLVFILSSVIFVISSLKFQYQNLVESYPDIVVSKNIANRFELIDEKYIDEFLSLPAVSGASGRVWGEYRFKNENGKSILVNLIGIDPYEDGFGEIIANLSNGANIDTLGDDFMISSPEILQFLQKYIGTYDSVPFFTPDSFLVLLKPRGELARENGLFNANIIFVSQNIARKILGIDEGKFSDIVLNVANSDESEFVRAKIEATHNDLCAVSKSQIGKKFEILYDYKGGIFLAILLICVVTFAIILFDKLSGLKSEEKREIAILRALGWDVGDIIKSKIFESFIFALFAFLIGFALAIFYVYFASAPILSQILTGFSSLNGGLNFSFYFDLKIFVLLFALSVPLYVAVCIIPAFRAATTNISEALK